MPSVSRETTVTRPADDCRRRGAQALHVTRGYRVSSSLRAWSFGCSDPSKRPSRPGTCYEPWRNGFLWRRLADDAVVRVLAPGRPRDADAMRRRSAPGYVQGRATSMLCGFSPPHTRMHVLFGCTEGI